MCLEMNRSATETLKNSGKKFIYCYKVLTNGTNKPPFYDCYDYKAGFNYAGEEVDIRFEHPYNHCTVAGGALHVFTTRQAAESYRDTCERIVPVRCYIKDLIAVGIKEDACFTRIHVAKKYIL